MIIFIRLRQRFIVINMKNAQKLKLDDIFITTRKKRFVDFYMLDACYGFAFK